MKRNVWIAIVVSLVVGLVTTGSVSRLFAQEVTILGEIVDWNCYKKDAKNKGRGASSLRAQLREGGRAAWHRG